YLKLTQINWEKPSIVQKINLLFFLSLIAELPRWVLLLTAVLMVIKRKKNFILVDIVFVLSALKGSEKNGWMLKKEEFLIWPIFMLFSLFQKNTAFYGSTMNPFLPLFYFAPARRPCWSSSKTRSTKE